MSLKRLPLHQRQSPQQKIERIGCSSDSSCLWQEFKVIRVFGAQNNNYIHLLSVSYDLGMPNSARNISWLRSAKSVGPEKNPTSGSPSVSTLDEAGLALSA